MQHTQDDMLVIQSILQGQHNAYATLVNKYKSYVFTLVLRYIDDRGLAEELAQDVFIKAYRCLADFKGHSKFSTWLYTIAHTTCLSHLRKKKNTMLLPGQEHLALITEQLTQHDSVTEKIEQERKMLVLNNAIASLPEEDGQILSLFYQAEQSVDEIGKILGMTSSNVKVRLFRARQKLREVLTTKFSKELS